MRKLRLMTPGPTMVPPDVTAEMSMLMDHHRTAGHRQIFKEVTEGLQYVFQTRGRCLIITGSGTAAMEAAIVGTGHPQGKVLVLRAGKFAERWGKICQSFHINHALVDLEWGRGFQAEHVADALAADPAIDTVILTHSETSTAAASDLQGIASVTRQREVLLVVDGITSVGALPARMDEWGVDVLVTGSQKALMLPPGLSFAAVSDRAWRRIESFPSLSFYNCLKAYKRAMAEDDSPYTPAITLMMGLRKALQLIRADTLENIWKRTARLAQATRAAGETLGMRVFAQNPSDSLTALLLPEGLDEPAFRKRLRSDHGIVVAGGQDQLKGKIVRLNHMGYVDEVDTIGCIAALEMVLQKMGWNTQLGAGVSAAMKVMAAE